jgi:DNA helicase-2/ATP-dependent DNA helicase PcrA
MQYTKQQQRAIDHLDGNLQVIACAGSGKTQVLAQRIINILSSKSAEGITPANIVAFTFTEKAAGELKDRIHRLCREQLGRDVGLAEMFVGTVHGFGLDLLQTYLFRFLKYSVLSEVQQRLLIDRYSIQSGLRDLATHDGKRLERWKDSRLYMKILSLVREAQIDESVLGDHPVRQALAKYTGLLHEHRYLDYSMILTEAVEALIEDAGLRQKMAERVKYLIVDEYQDVNPLQEALIRLLHDLGAQLCVVGDDDQTIYQWNGSDIANIVGFADRYPGVTRVSLAENFRSSEGVVESARQVVERNGGRLQKRMQSAGTQTFQHSDLLCLKFDNPANEARWIARKIQEMRGMPFRENGETRGLSWSDCAILLRSVKNSAGAVLDALREAGIPYVVKGMAGLFDTAEVKAACAVFHYLTGSATAATLEQVWQQADVGLTPAQIGQGIAYLNTEKADWSNRWQKSTYSLQGAYTGFLAAIELREEAIPHHEGDERARGEIVFYNLGKFSQVITDYEAIHFHTQPDDLYAGFSGYLIHNAPDYYPEGWEDAGFAQPDAVQVMTVHRAKGTEFPIVFLPNLVKNRFPTKGQGGRKWSHVLPPAAVVGGHRLDGGEADERRLLYVALTRAKKYLYCSWAPEAAKGMFAKESPFVREITASAYVLTREPASPAIEKLPPRPRQAQSEILLTFSELKYFYECPYQFKLRFMYGFNPGFHEKIGFGKSLHDALAEIHHKALDGEYLDAQAVPQLLDTHLHLPYAWQKLRDDMRVQADRALRRYLDENSQLLDKIEYAEKSIELKLANGIVVHGRIDLIRRTDTQQIIIIDFKSTERAQEEDITSRQLHIYALGYLQLTGHSADLIEIYNLDQGAGTAQRELVEEPLLRETEALVVAAGRDIRDNQLCRVAHCNGCDMQGICRSDICTT